MPSLGMIFFKIKPWANYSMSLKQNQGVKILQDGKKKWRERKEANLLLSLAYRDINRNKSERLENCGDVLTFRRYSDGDLQLHAMQSCRVRLCPICAWRRSLKIYHQVEQVTAHLDGNSLAYVMLTLTVRNMSGDSLAGEIQKILKGWRRLTQTKPFRAAVRGWFRSLEITHDISPTITEKLYAKKKEYFDKRSLYIGEKNPNFNYYHPHLHILMAVPKRYFKSENYISQARWAELWADAMGLDYIPSVDVRRCYSDGGQKEDGVAMNRAVAETSKYAAKSCEYVIPDDWELTEKTVKVLDGALSGVRLVAFGGVMRQASKELTLQDIESDNVDLVHVGEDKTKGIAYELVQYGWHTGYRQYVEI